MQRDRPDTLTFSAFCELMAALNKYWALVEMP
jgi:hypothetical protein